MPANHGFVMFGVKTTAAAPGGFTATVTFLGGAPIVGDPHGHRYRPSATTVTLTPPTAADGANLSGRRRHGRQSPAQGWVGNAFDSAGNAVRRH